MAETGTVVLGCDSNGMDDEAFMNAVKSKLESAGYTVEALGIAPGPFAEYSYSSAAQGKYGVYLMADSIVSIADYSKATGGANSNGTSFKMAVFGIRTDCIPKLAGDGWSKYPISPDADCTDVCNKIAHKTYPEIEEICKEDTRIVSGSTGEEMGNAIVAALGGKTQESGESEPSTIKEAIKDVLSGWEGEVEAYVRDMTMYIHKIKLPEQNTYLLLSEQHNIEKGSVTIKDYCPNNKNKLIVHWSGGEDIIIQDNKRIERFGEKEWEMEATKKVLKEEAPEETSDDSKKSNSSNDSDSSDSSDSSKTTDDSKTSDENNSIGYVEVPVETEEEALEFAHLEWNKNKRECCHEIELSTIGSDRWEIGRWCYVYLPSFEIEEYYYISRVSSNMSPNEWKTSLTLVPYPPKVENDVKEESEENSEDNTEDETKTNDENSTSTSTSND
jgi:hypothetical protein